MNREATFSAWAPEASVWSTWAKPTLFAGMTDAFLPPPPEAGAPSPDVAWAPLPEARCAIVVDVPGASAVSMGLALGALGYRPVPLFNGVSGPSALVPVDPVTQALQSGAGLVASAIVAPDAPPAFLLDSQRMAAGASAKPGQFDNRWLTFPQDFPSASFVLSRGIRTVVVVQPTAVAVAEDLAHVLARWQAAGIQVLEKELTRPGEPIPITVAPPSGFGSLLHRLFVTLKLKRNAAGGFGAIVPLAATGGGHYG